MGTMAFRGGDVFTWDMTEKESAALDISSLISGRPECFAPISPVNSLEEKKSLIAKRSAHFQATYRSGAFIPEECRTGRSSGPHLMSPPYPSYYRAGMLATEEETLPHPYAVFFKECTLSCIFCHEWPAAFSPDLGEEYEAKEIAERVNASNAHSLLFTGGEPLIHIRAVLDTILNLMEGLPVALSTNLFCETMALDLLDDLVDAYIVDVKAERQCSRMITGKENYFDIVARNIRYLRHNQPKAMLIIRHLLLPGHLGCCAENIFRWLNREAPEILFRIMYGYLPAYRSRYIDSLNRTLDDDEIEKAKALAKDFGLNIIE